MKLSVIIPVFNEEKTILDILKAVQNADLIHRVDKEIIIVDDCSSDRSVPTLKKYIADQQASSIHLLTHNSNRGKGAAIHTGIKKATGDFIVIQDADLEYDPEEYNILLEPIVKGVADVVYGSRFKGHLPHRILFFWHTIGNKFLTFLSNVFTNLNLSDMETCYKIFRAEKLKSLTLREKRFGFEPEVTAKISRLPGIRIYEVGISYYGRTYAEGKKINWKDGFRAMYCILKYNIWAK
ncbi:MAG: glycosyltransferase [Bacteroidetes bacterium]|jgi:glycosyltransferase involved in cell wall biosynthesis|nr:glycosyltransferase [Bacteroidota bacterium]